MTKNNDERSDSHEDKQKRLTMKKNKRRNVSRLGGSGLSLNAFANAKSNNSGYNPSLISMQLSLFHLLIQIILNIFRLFHILCVYLLVIHLSYLSYEICFIVKEKNRRKM